MIVPGRGGEREGTTLAFAATAAAPAQARRALDPLATELPHDYAFRLRLLVSELVANSVRHAGVAADATITLELEQRGGRIRVAVHDRGRGFETPVPKPGTEDPGGRGLDLVDALSSRWGTESGGRTVWFELDVAAAADRDGREAVTRRPGACGALRVVIADDYRLFADSLAGALDLSGDVEVVGIADDGGDAVALVSSLGPDLALVDLRMPIADGIEVTRRLQALGSATTIVVMSGLDDERVIVDALAAGAAAFVSKDDIARDPAGVVLALARAGGRREASAVPR